MPKLKLTLNLGSVDKKRLGLEDVDCKEGELVNVKADVAEVLRANGWAIEADAAGPSDEVIAAAARATSAGTFPVRQPRVDMPLAGTTGTPDGEGHDDDGKKKGAKAK